MTHEWVETSIYTFTVGNLLHKKKKTFLIIILPTFLVHFYQLLWILLILISVNFYFCWTNF